MKELSIEEKAKAYDKAIKVIKYNLDALNKITETGTEVANIQPIKNWFYRAFPELKESEDEKIKKRIIALVNAHGQGRYKEEMLAWLEERDKQEPFNYENINIQQKDFAPKSALEAINEEKVDNANKIRPKFNEGEWISGYCTNYKILSVNDNGYLVEDVDGNKINILFENEKFHHLFTIADVKDGDVLKSLSHHLIWIYKDNGHYACVSMNYITKNVYIDDGLIRMPSDALPATKDERDVLMKAMADAGYTFDFEKKELKKTEQKPDEEYNITGIHSKHAQGKLGEMIKNLKSVNEMKVEPKFRVGDVMRTLQEATDNITSGLPVVVFIDNEYYHCNNELIAIKNQDNYEYLPINRRQNSAWSEEDEKRIEQICEDLRWGLENFHSGKNVKGLHFEETIKSNIDWLKYLKERVQPQPKQEWSEEDKNRFTNLIHLVKYSKENNATKAGFIEFINKLKSLRPQSTWKLIDEYINTLEYFIRNLGESGYYSPYDNRMELLRLLLFDLKKLKE